MTGWKLRPGVVLVKIQGTHLLACDKEARKCCPYIRPVNELGAFIWKQLEDGKDRFGILSAIREEYDIPADRSVEKDTDAFIRQLMENHYILREGREHEV